MANLTTKGKEYKGGTYCEGCGMTADEFKIRFLNSGGTMKGVGSKWLHHTHDCDGELPFEPEDSSPRSASEGHDLRKRKTISAKKSGGAAKKKPKTDQDPKEQKEKRGEKDDEAHAAEQAPAAAPTVLQHIQAQFGKTHKRLAEREAALRGELDEMQRLREKHEAEIKEVRKGMDTVQRAAKELSGEQ